MMQIAPHQESVDLFASVAADGNAGIPSTPAIDSPLVAETREWLSRRAVTLGNLLSSERAAEYVACLRALAAFREEHEPEPLHEDVAARVCGEDATPSAEAAFKDLVRQLKEWGLVSERIEKERLRGYRDNRRQKFRYRICDDAVAFVAWLAERREHDLSPAASDDTGNLLDMQRSLLAELRRMLRRVDPDSVSYETAGDVLFRIEQVSRYTDATARTLQALNLRLLGFGIEEFSADEAKPIVEELSLFLERFGRRFGAMREDILRDVEEMRRECHAKSWLACAEVLEAESAKFRHIASVKVPDAGRILADAALFYAPDGTLVSLMARVGDSARKVWGKLNAKLRELERRNHRIEDLGARLSELATLGADDVPHRWLQRLLEPANMKGDAQARPSGEKSVPPKPKKSSQSRERKIVTWITPRKVGERPDVASITQERARRLRSWMETRGLYPAGTEETALSAGSYREFDDFPHLMQVIEYARLGGGEKAEKLLGVSGRPMGEAAKVAIGDTSLTFEDIGLRKEYSSGHPTGFRSGAQLW